MADCKDTCELCKQMDTVLQMHDKGIAPDTQKLKLKKLLGRQCPCRATVAASGGNCPYGRAWMLINPGSAVPTLPKVAVLPVKA